MSLLFSPSQLYFIRTPSLLSVSAHSPVTLIVPPPLPTQPLNDLRKTTMYHVCKALGGDISTQHENPLAEYRITIQKRLPKKKKKNKEGLSIPKTLVIKIVELLDSSSSPVSDKDTFWSKTKSGLATLWSWCISYGWHFLYPHQIKFLLCRYLLPTVVIQYWETSHCVNIETQLQRKFSAEKN